MPRHRATQFHTFTLRIPEELWQRIQRDMQLAKKMGIVTVADLIRRAIVEFLDYIEESGR